MTTDAVLTYGSYLRVEELLALQRERSDPPHHDELLFIVIHQVYELWFKQILHEIAAAMRNLDAGDTLKVSKQLRRIHSIQRLLEQQVDVLETMTPQEFNAFRSGLESRQRLSIGAISRNRIRLRHTQERLFTISRTDEPRTRSARTPARRTDTLRSAQSTTRTQRLCRRNTRTAHRRVPRNLRTRNPLLRVLYAA